MSEWYDNELLGKSNLTNGQAMLWTGLKLNPDDPIYNIIFTFDIQGALDTEIFAKSVLALIQKSDTLRTVVVEEEGIPQQMVRSSVTYNLQFQDFSHEQNPIEFLDEWLARERNRKYDLTERLFEFALLKLHNEKFVFALNQHHLIADAWGQFVHFRQLSNLYSILKNGGNIDAETIPAFSDFLVKERELRQQPNDRQRKYWKEKAQAVEPIKLYDIKDDFSTEASRIYFELGLERSNKIKKLVESVPFKSFNEDLSLYQLFCSVIFLYLHKVSGQNNLSFGTPTHNRLTPRAKETPGLFIEFFPMQITLDEEETLTSLHKKVVVESMNFLQNVKPGLSSPDVNRKFNILFNFVNAKVPDFDGNPVKSTYQFSGHNDPRHTLMIQTNDYDRTGNIKVQFDYKTGLFPNEIADFMADQFLNCIDSFLSNQESPLDQIEIVGKKERDFLINTLNDTHKDFGVQGTLIDLFQEQVHKTPDTTALVFEGQQMSYKELDEKSNKLAHYLVDSGVSKNEIVGLFLERSFEMIISILAVQKAGAAYLPIDPAFPEHRIQYILENSRSNLIIIKGQIDVIHFEGVRIINADDFGNCSADSINRSKDENLAYVIYTSGSTGNPKGVKIQHKAIKNRLLWMLDEFPITEMDCVLQKTPYTFDISVWELFWPLLSGSKLAISKPEGHKDPGYLKEIIRSESVSMLHFVPSMLEAFLEQSDLSDCNSIKRIFCSGEALPISLEQKFRKKVNAELHNFYGPTEASVEVVKWDCQSSSHDEIPIGKPVKNTQVYILNDKGALVPFGMQGNLFVSGEQLSDGYLFNDCLTKQKFVDNPFRTGAMYDTGDLAKYNKDGNILFRGRKDSQVKLRGHRIELGEVETVIAKHPKIMQVVVVVINGMLVCFYLTNELIEGIEVKRFIAQFLPDYMMPSYFELRKEFPQNHSGKIDRNELIKSFRPQGTNNGSMDEIVLPNTDMEELVLKAWQDVLKRDKISTQENFFEIGGDSLLGIRVITRIRESLEMEVPITLIFQETTISRMSIKLELLIAEILKLEQ